MRDIRIAVVQLQSRVGATAANIASIDRFATEAARRSVDMVCFPELCVCGYNAGDQRVPAAEPLDGDAVRALEKVGKRHGVTFLAGLLERAASGIVYNTQVVIGPQGLLGCYRKTHVPTSENGTWSQGGELPLFTHAKARFGVEICYDSHFPEVSALLAAKGAEILFLPHASGGRETPTEKKARWLRYMPARAYDNTVYVAVCNQVGDNGAGRVFAGVSFICDARGQIIAEAQSGTEEEMVVADLKAADLEEARRVPETFFRHFRRPEIYAQWEREA